MRIILTVFTFLFGMLAHAAHLAPWDTDGDGARHGAVSEACEWHVGDTKEVS